MFIMFSRKNYFNARPNIYGKNKNGITDIRRLCLQFRKLYCSNKCIHNIRICMPHTITKYIITHQYLQQIHYLYQPHNNYGE